MNHWQRVWLSLGLCFQGILTGCVHDEASSDDTSGRDFSDDGYFVEISRGEFLMGSANPEELGRYSECEGPRHRVRLTRGFRIGRCEVTVAEFRKFVAATNYVTEAESSGEGCNGLNALTGEVERSEGRTWRSPGFEQSDDCPVVCVSWQDAARYCEWLSSELNAVCRLPTEAEWEYCCRAGSDSRFFTGDDIESLRGAANCGDQTLASHFPQFATSSATWTDGYAFTAPVGQFAPNAFGLCDMHGNVGEWCSDWFDENYYTRSNSENPTGPDHGVASVHTNSSEHETAPWKVVRGGSWYNAPISLRASGRHDGVPSEASTTNGFRVVMELTY